MFVRRIVVIALSLMVSGFFLWLAVRDVPLQAVIDSIAEANGFWLMVSFAMIALGLWTRAVRWRGLLGFRISRRDAFHIVSITFLMNQLPLRAGEVARSLLATRSGIPVMTAATSIVVERIMDTLLVVIVLSVAVANLPDVPQTVQQAATFFGVAAVIATAVLVLLARYSRMAHRLLPIIKRQFLDHILDGLQVLTHWRSASHAILWTLISWTTSLLSFYAIHRALNIDPSVVWVSSALGMSLASFSIAIPMTVAAIGPFEGALRVAGEMVGISSVAAASLGFLMHGVALLGYAVFGTIGMVMMGASLGDMFKAKEKMQTDGHIS